MSVPASKLRILVLRDPGFRAGAEGQSSEVAAALAGEPGIRVAEGAAGYGEAVRTVQRSDADLVIVEDVAGDTSAVVEQIETAAPDLAIVVVLDEEQKSMAQPCILAGARAYVYRPFDPTELVDVVRRIHAKEDRRRRQRSARGVGQTGRIIAVHGAKGGVGATTLAVNLAVAAHMLTHRRIALVDANLMGGDIGVALNIASDNSIADVVVHLRELDGDLLDDTMVHHHSGVYVLPSPTQLERAEAITGDETASVLSACRAHFDFVVVDTASRLDEHALAALDLADSILLICTPEIASLKNTARFLQLGHELGYGIDKMQLVINRLRSHGAISLADIEQHLRHKMSFGLSSDGVPIIESLNAGEPVVMLRRRSRAARELRRLASEVVAQYGVEADEAAAVSEPESRPARRSPLALLGRLRPARAAAKT